MVSSGNANKEKVRVGLLIDSFAQPRWIHQVVQDIQSSSVATIALIIKNEAQAEEKKFRIQRYWQNRRHLLYAAYTRFDEFMTRPQPDAFASADIEPLVRDCPVIGVEPLMQKYTDRFRDEDVEEIHGHRLDVALRFGFRILKGRALEIARHGVWSYHHGDGSVNRGGPAGFWEVMEGDPVTGSMLQVLTEELDNGKILYRSWSPTSDKFSVCLNRNYYYWKSSAFVMRKLKELYERGAVSFEKNSAYRPYSHRLYRMPTNTEMLTLLPKLTTRYVASRARHFYSFDQWSLAYRFKAGPTDTNDAFYRFKYLLPPKDRFWADPFPVKAGDRYFIFIEEYVYASGKGHISVIEIDGGRRPKAPVRVLEKDYHLSYPFTFEWRGEHYMIPETASHGSVELYKAVEFPFRWEMEKTLLEGVNATDATLMEADGLWWMFVNVGERDFPTDWNELYLYYADRPMGDWKPHKANPVKTDVRGSRPAGRVFRRDGELYRPAQDSSRQYGYAVSINRIVRLSPDEFAEEEVSKILPRWDKKVVGTHTLNSAGDLTVIDCLMRRGRLL